MKLETVKTTFLILLIGTSFVLTFGIWNYTPDDLQTLDESSIETQDLGGTEESKRTLIEPSEIVFHQHGEASNNHYAGFVNPTEKYDFYEMIHTWTFYDFETEEGQMQLPEDYQAEVIFPDAIPMELIGDMMVFNDGDRLLPSWSFDRIFISMDNTTSSIVFEFYSIDGRNKARAVVDNSTSYNELAAYIDDLENEERYSDYTVLEKSDGNIYLPADEVEINQKSISISKISPSSMVDVLFNNPSIVNSSSNPGESMLYFTDSRQMLVESDGIWMEYVNPFTETNNELLGAVDLLDRSISNINTHKGWTSDYQIDYLSVVQNRIDYRMYHEGYPVFNETYPDLAVIGQKWNSQQLVEYRRSLFRFSSSSIQTGTTLPSGEEIIEELVASEDYDLELVEDVKVGYELNMDEADLVANLVPTWYVKYNSSWIAPEFFETETAGMRGVM